MLGDDVARVERAAYISVRHAARQKDELFARLTPELRQEVFRSPSTSVTDQIAALRRDPFSGMLERAVVILDEIARAHPRWGTRAAHARRLAHVYLPSRALRERVLRVADSEGIAVELGDALLLFLVKLAAIVGRMSEAVAASELERLLDDEPSGRDVSPQPAEQLRDLLSAILVCGHPGIAPSLQLGPAAHALANQLSTAMVFFVTARALAHHLLDDFDDASTIAADLDGLEVRELLFSFEREAEVDQIALDLMARAAMHAGVPRVVISVAPFLFLHGTETVRRGLQALSRFHASDTDLNAGGSVLSPFASERLVALASSGPATEAASAIRRRAASLGQMVESLAAPLVELFARCGDLGLAPGFADRRSARHAFWLTPLAYGADGHAMEPFYRIQDRARVDAIHEHLGQLQHLRPYVHPWAHDVVICYRASLYLDSARRLGTRLRAAGVDALHDELFVAPGISWEPQLRQAIEGARMVVMLVSLVDLGSGLMDDLRRFPIVKELGWVGEHRTRLFAAGVSHLSVRGQAGAIFRSTLDILRAVADDSWIHPDSPVLMVHSEDGCLPPELDAVLTQDVQEELAQIP